MPDSLCPPPREYFNMDRSKVERMLQLLRVDGYDVRGNNPWFFDTRKHGVKLHSTWFESESRLHVEVMSKNWYVRCKSIWDELDRHMAKLEGPINAST
jgi:hypothetical protein